jgi:hypothetical protein
MEQQATTQVEQATTQVEPQATTQVEQATQKILNFELATVNFELAYYTNEGLEISETEPKNATYSKTDTNKTTPLTNYICNIQSVNGALVYAVVNHTTAWYDPSEKYTVTCILSHLIKGHLDIGYISTYISTFSTNQLKVIKHICPFDHEDYTELRLHYTTPRSNPQNCAWRSINWDLFGLDL